MAANVESTSAPVTAKQTGRFRPNAAAIAPFAAFLVLYLIAPRFAEDRQLTTLIYIGIYALLALGLNLLMGYAGQVSLGHAAFYGMGAYTSAILTLRPIAKEVIPGFSVGIGVMAGVAVLIALTKAGGWRLAGGMLALLVCACVSPLLRAGPVGSIAVCAAGMALWGLATKQGWRNTGAAGLAAGLVWQVCGSSLAGVLARGGTSPWTAMLAGMLFTGLVAYLIGGQVLRLKGHYLAMATLGFGIIVEIVFRQWTAVTGGSSDGIYGIPTIHAMASLPAPVQGLFRALAGGELSLRQEYFYLVWAFVFVAVVLANNIVRSRVGRAFRAVHGSEVAAESLGVDTERYKVHVLVLSAALASLAGSLHAHNAGIGYINPGDFSFMVSVQLVVMVVVGGMASIWGALFGATTIQLLKNWMLNIDKSHPEVMGLTLKGLDPIVFGGVLIAVMIVLPQGLVRGLTDAAAGFLRAASRRGRKTAIGKRAE